MRENEIRSNEQMAAVLDYAPNAVIVSSVISNRLIYTNKMARELMVNQLNQTESVCYRSLGFDSPCPFCHACDDNHTGVTVREYRNPVNRRVYQRTKKQIDWAGEKAYIEYLLDITEKKQEEQAQLKLNHLVNSIPGGIASYRVEGEHFVPLYLSDGVPALTGHTREEFERLFCLDAMDIIYELDKERVFTAAQAAYLNGEVLDISYRTRHKNGSLIWIHLNGRRIGPLTEEARFYAVFTGISSETRLFQSIVNDTADSIYVIDQRNHELLYANESGGIFAGGTGCIGQRCYTALYGKSAPCEFCTLEDETASGIEHEIGDPETGRFYRTRFRAMEWNGIPAYIKYVRDITGEVSVRREKERFQMYFKTIVDKLPGGVSVVRINRDGSTVPEYISDGFAAITHMTIEELEQLYGEDFLAGIHPGDLPEIRDKLRRFIEQGAEFCELSARMKRGDGGYVWVKDNISIKRLSDGSYRLYCIYTDMTKTMEEKAQLRRQYEDMILHHYRTPEPDTLMAGHCNITQNRIVEIRDYTNSGLFGRLGTVREEFFTGVSAMVVDEEERERFQGMFLNKPMMDAFKSGNTERALDCFIRLSGRDRGCYARFKVNLVEVPDTGDVTGILTVADITEQTIADRILHRLSTTSHDYIIDLDLGKDYFQIIAHGHEIEFIAAERGCFSEQVERMADSVVLPKDRELYRQFQKSEIIRRKLKSEGAYTFTYSETDRSGDVRNKNMTVTSIDLKLERVCLACTDITDSVRKQQGLLNMLAYTFDLAGFIHVSSGYFTMYTRETILGNLPPYTVGNYNDAVKNFVEFYESPEEATRWFHMDALVETLSKKPLGYDFILPYLSDRGLSYKQINVVWGDPSHELICIVRADVTEMMTAERQSKKRLELALSEAERANQAKSEFLSAMSHDIRTPMNAIMGMTTLAEAHLNNPARVEDCLRKISISSRHLLSLINDVLDMSKIERSQITFTPLYVCLNELMEEISAIIMPQAKAAGLQFSVQMDGITHSGFYGDSLRVSQILINLLSNAIKFTPEGGRVDFSAEEMDSPTAGRIRYRFTVCDTGIGMSEDFLARIYDPFARDRSVVRIEGTGLGLSITRGLVDLMGGKISIESKVGTGSRFHVELEFEEALAADREPEKARTETGREEKSLVGCRFLVAEDNELNAEILCEVLAMHDAETVVRRNGLETVRTFQNMEPGAFDAILMDIQMPQMDGYEATRVIRSMNRPDCGSIPIIAMTANAFAEDIQEAFDAGMNAHVAKPIDFAVLYQVLGKALITNSADNKMMTEKE